MEKRLPDSWAFDDELPSNAPTDADNSTILCSIRRVAEARRIVVFERGTGVEKGMQ
jgi:hypothetical protein